MINLNIDNIAVQVEENSTILDAAKKIGVDIPTLCYHEDLCVAGNCRVCVVEIEGRPRLETSCSTPVEDNMIIKTNSPKVRNSRKIITELLNLFRHIFLHAITKVVGKRLKLKVFLFFVFINL